MWSILKSFCVCIESVLFNYETFHIKKTWGAGANPTTMGGGLSFSTDSETSRFLAPACKKENRQCFSKNSRQNCSLKRHVAKEKGRDGQWFGNLGSNASSASYRIVMSGMLLTVSEPHPLWDKNST